MTFKSQFAKTLGKSSYWALHKFSNGGTSFPGKIATKFDSEILTTLAKDYDVIVVTGTNGKTMTTSLIVEALKKKYDDVLTNPSGSNMQQGIVTAFLAHKKIKTDKKRLAVLEVDEANVPIITKYVHPKAYVLTNIFRDQMDRYGEIYTTYEKILDGIYQAPEAKVIANGDASIFHSKNLQNELIYFGYQTPTADLAKDFKAPTNTDGVLCPQCNHILHYHMISYANLGDYFCPNCGFKRPELKYQVTAVNSLTPNAINFDIENEPIQINMGGQYNVYNALAAYAVAQEFGVAKADIIDSFRTSQRLFGRQELIDYHGKKLNIILVKNPVGLNEVLSLLDTEPSDYTLAALLNAHHADGIDTSWIWDGNFEELNQTKIRKLIVGGERYKDMAYRLEVAGFDPTQMIISPELDGVLREIDAAPTENIYILNTYTAMLALRKKLAEEKVISGTMG